MHFGRKWRKRKCFCVRCQNSKIIYARYETSRSSIHGYHHHRVLQSILPQCHCSSRSIARVFRRYTTGEGQPRSSDKRESKHEQVISAEHKITPRQQLNGPLPPLMLCPRGAYFPSSIGGTSWSGGPHRACGSSGAFAQSQGEFASSIVNIEHLCCAW